ncbi:hypothetical protein GQ53DRAFT_651850 [Thozetella sp. PMI_491]|nr:hypothetical protein GQ53DRAFT_651850 [Thozetella sp. PMI_491]
MASSRAVSRSASYHSEPARRDPEKERQILEACKWRHLDKLRALAETSGGFLNDDIRQQAWPVLLGLASSDFDQEGAAEDVASNGSSWKELPRHRDEDQVRLDVDRAFVYYPNCQSEAELTGQKQELSDLILQVLRRYPYLCYFQGYHDICQVLLLVLPDPVRAHAVARLSALRIRDFMLPSLDPAISQLHLIPDILRAADPALWRHLSDTQPFFALSGTLTMYAHDITTLGEIARLFDVLLAREPVFTVYMFAAIVRSRREELFDTPSDEPEMLHSILSKLPSPLDLEALIGSATELSKSHPPETLRAWRAISKASVLKTARDGAVDQSMEDGRIFFDRQVAELQWREWKKKALKKAWQYRTPVSGLGLALLVGVAAILMRRSPGGPLVYTWSLVSRFWYR